ncbi:MAG: hypothetical protein Ct9H90mP27_2560 [Gammaproteobacteria bacterium]|nr:MAG: hypothetical protein Ct9H90mP27_2560 [Gammaproteobacteria bacterium]
MIRSSAKNFRDVIVVVDPSDYEAVITPGFFLGLFTRI